MCVRVLPCVHSHHVQHLCVPPPQPPTSCEHTHTHSSTHAPTTSIPVVSLCCHTRIAFASFVVHILFPNSFQAILFYFCPFADHSPRFLCTSLFVLTGLAFPDCYLSLLCSSRVLRWSRRVLPPPPTPIIAQPD